MSEEEKRKLIELGKQLEAEQSTVKKTKHKKAFSKVMVTLSFVFGAAMLSFAMLLMWVTKDTSPLGELIIGACGFIGTVVAFYINMAKAEHIQCNTNENTLNTSIYEEI